MLSTRGHLPPELAVALYLAPTDDRSPRAGEDEGEGGEESGGDLPLDDTGMTGHFMLQHGDCRLHLAHVNFAHAYLGGWKHWERGSAFHNSLLALAVHQVGIFTQLPYAEMDIAYLLQVILVALPIPYKPSRTSNPSNLCRLLTSTSSHSSTIILQSIQSRNNVYRESCQQSRPA